MKKIGRSPKFYKLSADFLNQEKVLYMNLTKIKIMFTYFCIVFFRLKIKFGILRHTPTHTYPATRDLRRIVGVHLIIVAIRVVRLMIAYDCVPSIRYGEPAYYQCTSGQLLTKDLKVLKT